MADNQLNFDTVFKITHKLLQIQDLDMLLEYMLTEAKDIVNADAGSIYLVEGSKLKFSYTQNNTLQKKLSFGKKLIYSTFSVQINNQSIAGYVANTGMIVNLADAYHIDSFQPYSFDNQFDQATSYLTRSILAVPIKTSSGKIIGVMQLINAIGMDKSIRSFTSTEEAIIQVFADNIAIAIEHAQMIRSMIVRMNRMLELHASIEIIQHNNCVSAYAVEIYEAWAHKKGISEKEIRYSRDSFRMAAMLHDIGKIAIPASILKKRYECYEELTPKEIKDYRLHTVYGAQLFSNGYSKFEEMAQAIALDHHENWDGSGYPGRVYMENGLSMPGYEKAGGSAFGKIGNEISIYARIVAVAGLYDKLMHAQADTKEKTQAEINDFAVNTILAKSGKQFDPEVVSAFVGCIDVIKSIAAR